MSAQGRRSSGRGRGRSAGSGQRGAPRGGGRGHGRRGRSSGGDAGDQPPPRVEPGSYVPPPPRERHAELEPTNVEYRGLRLYPFQVEAFEAIRGDHSVLVAAPTGSGKTLVADYAIESAFREGGRVVYTAPIKALSNQKYRDFRAQFGDQVGILTGDVTIQPDADLLIMTTEVFRNTLFESPHRFDDFRFVVHDEIHYLDDPERGTVWEESIIHAPDRMRIVGLSATIPNVNELAGWIRTLRGEDVTVVEMRERPVPLDHRLWVPDFGPMTVEDGLAVLHQPMRARSRMRSEQDPSRVLDWLTRERLLPALVFCFSRRDCERHALANRRRRLLTEEEQGRMATFFDELALRFECRETDALERLRELAVAGLAYHHAGMLPVHKEIVERLFTSGLIRVLFATETFALGVNMPARSVLFLSLRKFDGERVDYMMSRSYGQMAGRAGRQGLDDHGLVLSMIDPQRDRPAGVKRVISGSVEPVRSRWNPDYSTILSLYQRMGERVLETYQRSFARYQRASQPGAADRVSHEERMLIARLALLKRTGYVRDGTVSAIGRFVARVNGYDIQAGEWRDAGLFDRLDARRLAAVLLSATYEPRPRDTWGTPRDRKAETFYREAHERIVAWREKEWKSGLTQLTQEPHFGLTAALELWLDGKPLQKLADVSSATEGDLVRHFRLVLQFIRQIDKALPDDDPTSETVRAKLHTIMRLLDRDEVDARRQIELGQDPVEDGEFDEDARQAHAEHRDQVREPEPKFAPEPAPEPEPEFGEGLGLD